jgi:NADH:ubiquinone oxidoreductase subunit H
MLPVIINSLTFFSVWSINNFSTVLAEKPNHFILNLLSFFFFFILLLFGTKKWPFEFVESEHELSSGIFIELFGLNFSLAVLSEYIILIF